MAFAPIAARDARKGRGLNPVTNGAVNAKNETYAPWGIEYIRSEAPFSGENSDDYAENAATPLLPNGENPRRG